MQNRHTHTHTHKQIKQKILLIPEGHQQTKLGIPPKTNLSFIAVTSKNMREGLLTGAETKPTASTKPTTEWVIALRNWKPEPHCTAYRQNTG